MATEKHIQLLLKGEARGLELAKEGGLNTQARWGEKRLPPAMCSPNPSQGPSYMMTKPKQTFDYNIITAGTLEPPSPKNPVWQPV